MDELTGRKMPWAPEAEQAVIGSCLIDPHCISEIVAVLHSEDFYLDQNREIFDTIYQMFTYAMTIDPVTVLNQMKVRGVYREESSQRYVRELMEVTPTSANVMKYVQIVRDQALLRSLITACDEVIDAAAGSGSSAGDVLDLAEKKIYALRQGRVIGGLVPASQVVQTVYAHLSELAQSGKSVPGLSTGLRDLDRRLMGLNNSDFILVASRPGMGKTSLALNMAMASARDSKKTVAVFSLEMSREQLVQRLLSAEGRISLGHLITGNLSVEEWRRAAQAANSISTTDIRINDNPTLSVAEMNAQCRRLDNLGLVVIDYLQLMQSSGSGHNWSNESRTQAVSDISRMIKIMAKELNVPVICLSQLSRSNETREDKRPRLSDLRESGSIEQDADIVIGIYREGYYKEECENPNLAEAIVLKNRHGETGKDYLIWQGEYTSFVNAEISRDEG